MTDITIEALKLRRRAIEINRAMNQGALEEIDTIISEMERRRGGRPRKLDVIPKRVAGGVHQEPECDDEGELPSIDDVRGILKIPDPPEAA